MTDNTAAALTQEPKVTYGRCNDTVHKVRFSQFAKDPLPVWAVDVQPETEPAASVADTLGQQCAETETALHRVLAATAQLQPRTLDAPVSDADIRAVSTRNGFTVKQGQTDLKPYVYSAARELLEFAASRAPVAQPAPVQITGKEAGIHSIFNACMFRDECRARDLLSAAPTPPRGESS